MVYIELSDDLNRPNGSVCTAAHRGPYSYILISGNCIYGYGSEPGLAPTPLAVYDTTTLGWDTNWQGSLGTAYRNLIVNQVEFTPPVPPPPPPKPIKRQRVLQEATDGS